MQLNQVEGETIKFFLKLPRITAPDVTIEIGVITTANK